MTSSPINRDMSTGPGSETIRRVEPEEQLEAITSMLAAQGDYDRNRARKFIQFANENGISLDHLWAWFDSANRPRSTVLAVPNRGRTAMLFASHPLHRRDVDQLARLIDHACLSLIGPDVHLMQALLDPSELLERRAHEGGGFRLLARLSYFERRVPRKASPPELPEGMSIDAWSEDQRDDLLEILEGSYEDTLDCPDLRGLRETEDILEGHRATGEFDPDLWSILRINGKPAGTLLLNPSQSNRSIELVYLGLVPAARGRGLGAKLLQHGLARVAGRPERTITLAVDERNQPAIALYHNAGFRSVLRRIALIRPLREHNSSSTRSKSK